MPTPLRLRELRGLLITAEASGPGVLPEIARKSYFQHSHKRASRLTMLLYHARSRVEQMQEEHAAVTRTVSRCLVPQLLSTITLLDPRKLHPDSEPRWLPSQY